MLPDYEELRCHELVHALAQVFPSLMPVDGKHGMVEHSWLWCRTWDGQHVLDPYAVGQVPQVQLVDTFGSPNLYKPGPRRGDPNRSVTRRLVQAFWADI